MLAAGCFPPEDPYDPIEQAKRDAEAAERGTFRRGRRGTWFVVKSWAGPGKGDAVAPKVIAKGYGEALFSVARLGTPPRTPHSSILLQEGQCGFVAVSRGAPVSEFVLAGETYGGGGVRADRGFDVTVRAFSPREAELRLTPVFRGLAEGGADLRLEELAFEGTLPAEEALAVLSCGMGGLISRAFWRGGPSSGERRDPRSLLIQLEAFR